MWFVGLYAEDHWSKSQGDRLSINWKEESCVRCLEAIGNKVFSWPPACHYNKEYLSGPSQWPDKANYTSCKPNGVYCLWRGGGQVTYCDELFGHPEQCVFLTRLDGVGPSQNWSVLKSWAWWNAMSNWLPRIRRWRGDWCYQRSLRSNICCITDTKEARRLMLVISKMLKKQYMLYYGHKGGEETDAGYIKEA